MPATFTDLQQMLDQDVPDLSNAADARDVLMFGSPDSYWENWFNMAPHNPAFPTLEEVEAAIPEVQGARDGRLWGQYIRDNILGDLGAGTSTITELKTAIAAYNI